ncbi:hypothetical protein HX866_11495 [Pseudomonas gingeri]|uniref:hypothetical protein n=1 Tax=Pseudomonas gingeri TaxID=117681 RepID=UPI0015A35566|nr:hypothetical protein [Pseudomonas gingeri]NWA25520.1 hypothetical protein [Pseudomonas gingeri]
MMPGNSLSSKAVPSRFAGARALSITKLLDYEDGGIAIQDPSQGLLYQRWRARLINDQVWVDAPNTDEFVMFEAPGMTEISLTFDQNMRPALAYIQAGVAKIWWYDSGASSMVITEIGAAATTPRITLDDKRVIATNGNQTNDIILAYVRDQKLCFRQQRERFLVERVLATGITTGLIKIGLNRQLRLQFMFEVPK